MDTEKTDNTDNTDNQYHDGLSKTDFVKSIEKRIKKDARQNDFFLKSDILLVKSDFVEAVLKDIVQGLPVKIVRDGEHTKEVVDICLDDDIREFMNKMFRGEDLKSVASKDVIKIFRTVKANELEKYAGAKGFMYTPKQRDETDEIIQSLEKKHHETMFAMLKTMNEIDGALQVKEKEDKAMIQDEKKN